MTINAQKIAPPDIANALAAASSACATPRLGTMCEADAGSTGSFMGSSSWPRLLHVPGADGPGLFDQRRTVQSLGCHFLGPFLLD